MDSDSATRLFVSDANGASGGMKAEACAAEIGGVVDGVVVIGGENPQG